ncbi:MAG: isochorismate synthase [Chlorobium sp.]|nr:isochorismate synthase [Chlorobium phaeovibrioides]NQU45724.1 isochorismate synthase [Chlorobium sp.]
MHEQHHIIIPSPDPLPIEQAIRALKASILEYAPGTIDASGEKSGTLAVFRQTIPAIDPLKWLSAQSLFPRIFWMNRERDYMTAAIGAADTITHEGAESNEENFKRLGSAMTGKSPDARYFGGFRFNSTETGDPAWEAFPPLSFTLPLLQLSREGSLHTLTCHLWTTAADGAEAAVHRATEALNQLQAAPDKSDDEIPSLLSVTHNPTRDGWIHACEKALEAFASGSMEKIMLARQTVLEFTEAFSPLLFLQNYPYPDNATYRFYFEPSRGQAFFSFTPERLYRRNGQSLVTEALAGTHSKTNAAQEDNYARDALLSSEKDIREHRFVRDMIYDELQPACSSVDMEEGVRVLQLNRLAHLYNLCRAELKEEFSNEPAVLSLMHPTPAVGGVPKKEAMRRIPDLETFSRGWYAAPAGWVSSNSAEFCVGIRSALVNGQTAYLYSGAGLVKGSDPAAEWDEVEQKIGDLMSLTRPKA